MRRSTRYNRPGLSGSSRSAMLLGADGDGSTLSLDFTTGVLDPRLTFTRGSDATFINSQGFVQYAAVNYFRNTGWTSGTTPTGWNVTFGTGTTTWNADGTLTMTAGGSAVRPCINATSFSVAQGIPFTFGFRVTAVSGSPTIDQVISSTVAGETFSRNGATVSGSTVVQNGDIISCTFTPTTTSNAARMGPGVNVGVTNISITITQPQFNPGTTLQPYYANTSTIAARWDSARFDYDPTTGAPRGLLLEGTATNLLNWSESFATSGGSNNHWNDQHISRTTGQTDPANTTTAIRFECHPGNATVISSAAIGGAPAARTFSVWLRRVTGTGDIQYTQNNGTNWTTQAITSTWTRYSFTHTANHQVGIRIVTNGDAIAMWGAQLETGSGASSYIPTGASQATRVQDSLSCVSPNFAPWYQAETGTLLTDVTYTALSGNQSGIQFADATGVNETNRLAIRRNIAIATRAAVTSAQYSPTATGRAISAFAYANANYKFSQNGASFSLVAGGTGNVPQNIDRLVAFTPGPEVPYGWVRRIKFWPTALPQATLNSITTL